MNWEPPSSCPREDRLELLIHSADADAQLQEHVASCPRCSRYVADGRENDAFLRAAAASLRRPVGDCERSLAPGESVPGYQIFSELSRGGQGIVYQATQLSAKRTVALKTLLRGPFASLKQRLRFEREVELIAALRHPNIVTVYDSGVTPDGRPYFAMEYVDGIPLDEWMTGKHTAHRAVARAAIGIRITEHGSVARAEIRNPKSQIRDVLSLFAKICSAVSYAHQHGIAHRDLKPANILVDSAGEPHILDFGLAKLADGSAPDLLQTVTGEFMGTLAYASPEQLRGETITTASDVYSLGVILFELLTGRLPCDLSGVPRHQIPRIICEQPPDKPSAVVLGPRRSVGKGSSSWNTLAENPVVNIRPLHSNRLRRLLTGDLDTIVLKALHKDPQRRYRSAEQFSEDIRRHGEGLPVIARADTFVYLASKFLRRHALASAATVAVILVLVAATIVAGWSAHQARLAREQAIGDAKTEELVSDFLVDLLVSADPFEAEVREKRPDVTVREIVDQAARRLPTVQSQPLVYARLSNTLGRVYRNLGMWERAGVLLEESLAIRARELGDEHPDTLESAYESALLAIRDGRYAEAEELLVKTVEIYKGIRGQDHPDAVAMMTSLASLYKTQGRHDQAEALLLKLLEIRRRISGEEHPSTLKVMNNLAAVYRELGRDDQAEELFVKTLEIRRRLLGPEHPSTLTTMNNLAVLYTKQARYDEAEQFYSEVLQIAQRVLPENHPDVLVVMNGFGLLYSRQGRYEEAAPLLAKTLEIRRVALREGHPSTLGTMSALGEVLAALGRSTEAEELLAGAVEGARRSLPPHHLSTGQFLGSYGRFLAQLDCYDEAEAALLESHEILNLALGPKDARTQKCAEELVDLYQKWGQPEASAEWQDRIRAAEREGESTH